jgi:hypothetical protein
MAGVGEVDRERDSLSDGVRQPGLRVRLLLGSAFGQRVSQATHGRWRTYSSACLPPPHAGDGTSRHRSGTRPPSRGPVWSQCPRRGPRRMHRLGEVKLCIGGTDSLSQLARHRANRDSRRHLSLLAHRGGRLRTRGERGPAVTQRLQPSSCLIGGAGERARSPRLAGLLLACKRRGSRGSGTPGKFSAVNTATVLLPGWVSRLGWHIPRLSVPSLAARKQGTPTTGPTGPLRKASGR